MSNKNHDGLIAKQNFQKYLAERDTDPEVWMNIAIGENSNSDDLQSFLSLIDNEIDILSAAADSIELGKNDVWLILHVVEKALPQIVSIKPNSLIRLCDTQYKHTKNDGARGLLFNVLTTRLSADKPLCIELITALRTEFRDAIASLYPTAVIALSAIDSTLAYEQAHGDSISEIMLLAENAVSVLGQLVSLQRLTESEKKTALKEITRQLKNPISEIHNSAIFAIVKGAMQDDQFAKELSILLEQKNRDAACYLALILFQQDKKFIRQNTDFDFWLTSLVHIPIDAFGAIDNLDFQLASLFKDNEQEKVTIFIEKWIIAHQDSHSQKRITELFASTFRLIERDGKTLPKLLTKWLVDEDWPLVLAANDIFRYFRNSEDQPLIFCTKTVDGFDDEQTTLLLKRMLGFSIEESQLLSLTLSLLDIKKAKSRIYGFIEEILLFEIGEDYPDATIKALKKLKKKRSAKGLLDMCDRVIGSINNYFDALSDLPRIKELSPNPEHIRQVTKERNKVMAISQKEAKKDSIMRMIATVIPMKSGRAQFSYFDGKYRDASPLHEYHHSFTLPRRQVLDAIGDEMRRHLYRSSVKSSK